MKQNVVQILGSICMLLWCVSCSDTTFLSAEEEQWLKRQDTITVAMYPYYAPYQFLNANEKIDGILMDHLSLIEQKIGYSFQHRVYSNWTRLIEDAKAGKIDMVLEIQRTQERDAYLNFYLQLFSSDYVMVSRKDRNFGNQLEAYRDKKVTVPLDYGIHEILRTRDSYLQIFPEKDDVSCLRKVYSRAYDMYVGPKAVANFIINTEDFDGLQIVDKTPYTYNPSLGVQKDNLVLNQIIAKATKQISEAEKQAIYDNWLYYAVTPFYKQPFFWGKLTAIIVLLVIMITACNKYLWYHIQLRTQALRKAKQQVEESMQAKTAFIHNISHEIRTPMNGIIGFSELLHENDITEHKKEEYTDIIVESSNRLIRTIDDIIEISTLHNIPIKIQETVVHLEQILTDVVSDLEHKAKDKKLTITIENEVPITEGMIYIDVEKVYKVLFHIIDNAIKFTDQGQIQIRAKIESHKLVMTVKDTGIGIAIKDQERIFKNFTQAVQHTNAAYEGLGLGLAIAQKNALLIRGKVSIINTSSEGTQIQCTVPYQPVLNTAIEKKQSVFSTKKPLRHVIVIDTEDDSAYQTLRPIVSTLASYRVVIYKVAHYEEALQLLEGNSKPKLCIVGISSPLLTTLRMRRKFSIIHPDLSIVMVRSSSFTKRVTQILDQPIGVEQV